MKEYRLKVSSCCPICGHAIKAATGLDCDEAPRENDLTLCINCGAVLCFSSGDGVRRAEDADLKELSTTQKHLVLKARYFIERRGRLSSSQ